MVGVCVWRDRASLEPLPCGKVSWGDCVDCCVYEITLKCSKFVQRFYVRAVRSHYP